jgi:hypothetical protein
LGALEVELDGLSGAIADTGRMPGGLVAAGVD